MHKAVLSTCLAAVFSAVIAVAASAQTTSADPKTFEYTGGGQWAQLEAPATQRGPIPTLDRVEKLLQSRQNKAAEKLAIEWVLANQRNPQRDRGLYLIAQALYQYGNRVRAYYYCDELMDEYPESRYFSPALEMQYRIADRYLNGYKRRFLGVPMFHAQEEAVEMLYRIQSRSPGSQLAESALLRTANFYYNDKQYDFAADTYAAYLRKYPRSPQNPRVRLRQAYSMYAQFRGPRFDATPVIDAREQLRSLVATSPQLAQEENIPGLLDQLDRNLARKLYVTGDFYRRTREPRGAAYTFRYLEKAYPNTPEAARAKVELAKLPAAAVVGTPNPAITPGYAFPSAEFGPRILPSGKPSDSRTPQPAPPQFR
ncbi:MAG: outer membrane protein assembly factor BamD [Tepidisphaeraceae bacterium]